MTESEDTQPMPEPAAPADTGDDDTDDDHASAPNEDAGVDLSGVPEGTDSDDDLDGDDDPATP